MTLFPGPQARDYHQRRLAHRRCALDIGPHARAIQREKPVRTAEHGQASVELVLILGVVLILVFGAFSLGQGVAVKHALDVATEKAARLLSIAPDDFAAADLLIRREVDASVLGGGYGSQVGISLAEADTGAPITAGDLSNAAFGYRFLVLTEVPFRADVPFLALAARTITTAHYGIVDRVMP